MKSPGLLLVAVLCLSSGCERMRTMAAGLGKEKPAAAGVPQDTEPRIVSLTVDDLGRFTHQRGKLTIIEYYASWNGQSMQMNSILQTLTAEFGGRVVVGRINIEVLPKFVAAQGVKNTPDVRFYSEGKLVDQFVGLPEVAEIREKVQAQVGKLPALPAPAPASAPGKPLTEPMKKDWLPSGLRRR